MNMSHIEKCDASECAYNSEALCRTLAVTIGDPGGCPDCDTFFMSESKGGSREASAGVGACKMASCRYNAQLECNAPSVSVGHADAHIHCLTFSQK